MSSRFVRALALSASLTMSLSFAAADSFSIEPLADASALSPAPMKIGGRVVTVKREDGSAAYRFQWPGVYFETAFTGARAAFRIGEGDAIYRVRVDDNTGSKLVKPAPGVYVLEGISEGAHTLRIDVVSENQGGAASFGGVLVPSGAAAQAPAARRRTIEFIGDSHTVGYGNTSPTRESGGDQVWLTTDTSQAFGPLVAAHFGADYQVNAISGRGIVRNYNGGAGTTLPEAYPFAWFDGRTPVADRGWKPQIVVIGLGTNDFSTALNPGEKWPTRDALHADYEASYVAFVQRLRARVPDAFVILAANDMADGEIQQEVKKVVERLQAAGDRRVGLVEYPPMELTACDWHPSLADHRKMAQALIDYIESRSDLWKGAKG